MISSPDRRASQDEVTLREVRRCYSAHHPLHAAYYFAKEHDERFSQLGLTPGPMAYFAGRAAPMGAVSPAVVAATFYNFNPELVATVLPHAWRLASPSAVLETRWVIVNECLTRLLGAEIIDSPKMSEAADLALRAVEGCRGEARPMYAANAALPVPDPPHLRLWHALTLLREHRGDGHVAILLQAGLDGLEALVTDTATGTNWKPYFLQAQRGWSASEWAAAEQRLIARGLLDPAGELTDEGLMLRRDISAATDCLDASPYRWLGAVGTRRLTELSAEFAKRAIYLGALPLQHLGKR